MPTLFHGTTKTTTNIRSRLTNIIQPTWWKQHVFKKESTNKNNNNNSASATTRDWRSLSPHEPPLPLAMDNNNNTIITSNNNNKYDIHFSKAAERSPKRLSTPSNYRSYDDGQIQKLSTIIEESDFITELSITNPRNSNHSNNGHTHHPIIRSRRSQSSIILPANSSSPSSSSTTSSVSSSRSSSPLPPRPSSSHDMDKNNDIPPPSPELPPNDSSHPSSSAGSSIQQQQQQSISSTTTSPSSSTSSSSTSTSFHPPPSWPIHPKSECRWTANTPSSLPISEKKAKKKLAKMIQGAFLFRQQHQAGLPEKMDILFDQHDNIDKLRLLIQDKIHYHSFKGNAQYIPPELSLHSTYHGDLVDVWVLGISLYRMLVGKYPFSAKNDRRLFNKMQQADFSIPQELTDDAKDLLRRMLSPDHTRASLDLVMFHPWLKPHTIIIPSPELKLTPQQQPIIIHSREISSSSSQPQYQPQHRQTLLPLNGKKKSKTKVLRKKLKKMMILIIEGPYPPPKRPYQEFSSSF
ncbi:hypothetical protein BJ944DRAFT_244644 [Cunninghamella echinulata]|nr:hypothetical protein BJ944DRAFT_244644 [Cunninghamella echinulata]